MKQEKGIDRENDPRYVKHFGRWINKEKSRAYITRDDYAKINRTSSVFSYRDKFRYIPKDVLNTLIFDDEQEKVFYTEEYCAKYQQLCLENYDINMARFSELNAEDFENILQRFIKRRGFKEVFSMDDELCSLEPYDVQGIEGYVYIMVLDAYKQAYIGITRTSAGKRIRQHWKKWRAFDRLLFGSVEDSVLSIDSFGALDTTRIFVMPYESNRKIYLEEYEYRCIKAFDQRYLLNRLR